MYHNTAKPTARSRAHAQRMAALAKNGSAGSYQPQAPIPLYPTPVFPPPALSAPPPCVFLGCGPKPKSKKDKARLEPNILHRAARKPWAQWSPRQRSELTMASNHVFWLVWKSKFYGVIIASSSTRTRLTVDFHTGSGS
jgi:hypothetical protein